MSSTGPLRVAHLELAAVFVGLLGVDGGGIAAPHQVAPFAADCLDIDFLVRVAVNELERRLE